ncbi:MAG: HAD-IIIA family hydrolase [Acinetobacter sp.]
MASYILLEQASHIKALVLDVDGILSDGFVTLSNSGDEIKSFDIRDGLGMKLVQSAGLKVIIITGRKSNIVEKRMSDLGVDLVFQGREDKGVALREACAQLNLHPEDCLYMGDDWPDLSAFAIAGMKVTVPNGHVEVRRRADLVTQAFGGRGAVREVCDMLLNAHGIYEELLEKYLATPHSS